MDFLNPNDKIRFMRHRFRINQADLEDTNMTRAFISMMESGKRRVSKTSSAILAKKFNAIANKISVKLDLDDEYFYRFPKEDAKFYCEKVISSNIYNHDEVEEFIEIGKKYELDDVLARLYKINGGLYFKENNFMKAFINFSNSLGKYKELNEQEFQPYLYNAIGVCKIERNENEEAVFHLLRAIDYAKEQENNLYYIRASYNLALAYYNIKDFDKCIEIINNNVLVTDIKEYNMDDNNARIVKANAMLMGGKEDDAVAEYEDILINLKEDDLCRRATIYNNIGEFYYKKEQYEKSLEYINKAQKIKVKDNKDDIATNVLDSKGKLFFKQGLYDESIMIFELAMSLAEQNNQFIIIFEIYKHLTKVCEEKDDLEKLEEVTNNFLSILEENNISKGKDYAIYKLVEIAMKQGNNDEAMRLLKNLGQVLENL
ncbi:tetratricopeptide repeat protein [Clostridium sp. C8-1-8]|uniref:tetratricopeptide repeat protein n=1 Tax=Clostridium sp. C8-1-8 TaxID=2698831 RepID=UPI001367FA66|nr:tetratricopeptide repeat protein [Clostridium sp. C8-1-8]